MATTASPSRHKYCRQAERPVNDVWEDAVWMGSIISKESNFLLSQDQVFIANRVVAGAGRPGVAGRGGSSSGPALREWPWERVCSQAQSSWGSVSGARSPGMWALHGPQG